MYSLPEPEVDISQGSKHEGSIMAHLLCSYLRHRLHTGELQFNGVERKNRGRRKKKKRERSKEGGEREARREEREKEERRQEREREIKKEGER